MAWPVHGRLCMVREAGGEFLYRLKGFSAANRACYAAQGLLQSLLAYLDTLYVAEKTQLPSTK